MQSVSKDEAIRDELPVAHPELGKAGKPTDSNVLRLDASHALLSEAQALIPGVTQSMMKRPEMFAPGEFPVYLKSGQGALVTDVDGNHYIDYVCGLGANMLGHNHPAVLDAIRSQLEDGLLHSLPSPVEVELTRELIAMIPGAEMARFFKTGADATTAAVRLSRHLTKRERIVTIGYNGFHDHFMFDTPGVPNALREYTIRMPLQLEAQEEPLLKLLEERGQEIALVLLSLPYNRCVSREFLVRLKATCKAQGIVFVFDEIVTGFRLARGGAQEYYDVRSDYVCVSKGMAAGMPLSAVVGPRDHLAPMADLQVSTTFGGELLSLAVCRAALRVYRETDWLERVQRLGERLAEGVNARAAQEGLPLLVGGYRSIPFFQLASDPATQAKRGAKFVAAMAKRGVLMRREVNFISGAHTEAQIEFTIDAAISAMRELVDAGVFSGEQQELVR